MHVRDAPPRPAPPRRARDVPPRALVGETPAPPPRAGRPPRASRPSPITMTHMDEHRPAMRATDLDAFREHLEHPIGRDHVPAHARSGTAGGARCGDLVRIDITVEGDRVLDAGFAAAGCGAAHAAGSAAVALVRGAHVLDAARVGTQAVAAELGGLSPGKVHAAELAADALHRALGAAVRHHAELSPQPNRTLVAMSGGVDSAVAALAVTETGREAVAVTLELWADEANDPEGSCCSASAVRGARALAHRLSLAHLTLDLRAEFRAGVVTPYLEAHAAGHTPNPCVRCNGSVRLDGMLALGERLGAADLATGHYARVGPGPQPLLRRAADPTKDQSYVLAALPPGSLARMRFPLGELTKPEVRARARAAGLAEADRPDSQDLCFLAGTNRAAFLAGHGGPRDREGEIVDRRGRRLGSHRGHHHFTVGQRRGLGLGGGVPRYVLSTDAQTNRVVVGDRDELGTTAVLVRGAELRLDGARVDAVRLRYRQAPVPCHVAAPVGARAGAHDVLELGLSEPVAGAAPGQLACLMAGDAVAGWGTIAGATPPTTASPALQQGARQRAATGTDGPRRAGSAPARAAG